jgi:hypothetical protein
LYKRKNKNQQNLQKKLGLIEKSALSDSGKEKLKDSLITKSLNIGKVKYQDMLNMEYQQQC